MALVVKNLPASAEDIRDSGSIPGLGRSPGGGHGNPLQYSCLESPHGQRSLSVHGLQFTELQSQTWLKWLSTYILLGGKTNIFRNILQNTWSFKELLILVRVLCTHSLSLDITSSRKSFLTLLAQIQYLHSVSHGLPGSWWWRIHLPMQETQAQSPGWEHLLEKETASHSSIHAWEICGQRRLASYSPWGCKESDMT